TDMERRLARAASATLWGGAGGGFLFTVLMITREGMEATLLLLTALFQVRQAAGLTGVGLGLGAAGLVGLGWHKLGRRVNIGILLNVSAVFLAVFLLQLLLYSVHELAEAGVLPAAQAIHAATEILGPDGVVGHLLTYLLALVPITWLAVSLMR